MSPIEFARAMRLRGWRYRRRKKGEALFGYGFPGGGGITRVFDITHLAACNFRPRDLAEFITGEARLAGRAMGKAPA